MVKPVAIHCIRGRKNRGAKSAQAIEAGAEFEIADEAEAKRPIALGAAREAAPEFRSQFDKPAEQS
jgi:hypothetical protein